MTCDLSASGYRTNAVTCDLSKILPEDVEKEVKDNAEISMGTEINEDDLVNIVHLCEQVSRSLSLLSCCSSAPS